tara:strand:+ start:3072 stop:4064 length:993 start_codon:yes stop_codon:yes gene_type:complete
MTEKEQIFKDKYDRGEFKFSYSSMNRLRFSPKLFYKDYILKDREVRTEKHLIEGRLLHLLLLQPDNFENDFALMPGKIPSDNVRKVLKDITLYTDEKNLDKVEDFIILDSLKHMNLYQSLKDENKRLAKIRTVECGDYYKFLSASEGKDIIDQDMYDRTLERVEIVKSKKDIMDLLDPVITDFELDETETFAESYLQCDLRDLKFGLKGYIDKYIIDHKKRTITIIDIKTSGKSIVNFVDTVDYYNYWLQAAIYTMLVLKNVPDGIQGYKINFNFIVVDTYNQVYNFEVSEVTMQTWAEQLMLVLKACQYHLDEMNFDLPYEFINNKVIL